MLKGKRGFTIVELVIVIAIIAILTSVLIPTFSSIVTKAKESSNLQTAENALIVLLADDHFKGNVPNETLIDVKYDETKHAWFKYTDKKLSVTTVNNKDNAEYSSTNVEILSLYDRYKKIEGNYYTSIYDLPESVYVYVPK